MSTRPTLHRLSIFNLCLTDLTAYGFSLEVPETISVNPEYDEKTMKKLTALTDNEKRLCVLGMILSSNLEERSNLLPERGTDEWEDKAIGRLNADITKYRELNDYLTKSIMGRCTEPCVHVFPTSCGIMVSCIDPLCSRCAEYTNTETVH